MKRLGLFAAGFSLTAFGMSLVFRHWEAVVLLFNGLIGMSLAVLGLVLLFAATIKSND